MSSSSPSRQPTPPHTHPLVSVEEFAFLISRGQEFVRRQIRADRIMATGRPALINYKEASAYGLTCEEAHALLCHLRNR